MAPTIRNNQTLAEVTLEPALLGSSIVNQEGLDKMIPMTVCDPNKNKATKIWSGLWLDRELSATKFPLFIHTIFVGVVLPFSNYFYAILSHYQIHTLHPQPNFVFLAIFAYLCEGFVGVVPSVALFKSLYSLWLSTANQCLGCASFCIVEGGPKRLST
ncbi:erythrocyte binding [Hordeum vulgare]|nr:erythrocyte binding [Hordeum vulgare]